MQFCFTSTNWAPCHGGGISLCFPGRGRHGYKSKIGPLRDPENGCKCWLWPKDFDVLLVNPGDVTIRIDFLSGSNPSNPYLLYGFLGANGYAAT